MQILFSILIALVVALLMEAVAWAEHKYVMHGFLWVLHEDHHRPSRGTFEKNDLFAVFFAVPSFLLIFFGLKDGIWPLPAVGIGLALYGIGYVLFHDILFHRRIKLLPARPKGRYWEGIINAHRLHHRVNTKYGAASFGFLYAPARYADPKKWPPIKKGR
jgi:beta-carotene 3-hydroxylase